MKCGQGLQFAIAQLFGSHAYIRKKFCANPKVPPHGTTTPKSPGSMFFNCIDPYSPRHLPFDHNSLVQPRELAACRILLWSTPQPSAEPCHVLNLMHTDWGLGSQVGSYTAQKLREARGAVRTLDFGPEGRAGGWISMLKRLAS